MINVTNARGPRSSGGRVRGRSSRARVAGSCTPDSRLGIGHFRFPLRGPHTEGSRHFVASSRRSRSEPGTLQPCERSLILNAITRACRRARLDSRSSADSKVYLQPASEYDFGLPRNAPEQRGCSERWGITTNSGPGRNARRRVGAAAAEGTPGGVSPRLAGANHEGALLLVRLPPDLRQATLTLACSTSVRLRLTRSRCRRTVRSCVFGSRGSLGGAAEGSFRFGVSALVRHCVRVLQNPSATRRDETRRSTQSTREPCALVYGLAHMPLEGKPDPAPLFNTSND
jgi:hypothetical protein